MVVADKFFGNDRANKIIGCVAEDNVDLDFLDVSQGLLYANEEKEECENADEEEDDVENEDDIEEEE